MSKKVCKPNTNTTSITNKKIAHLKLKDTTLESGVGVFNEMFLQCFASDFSPKSESI